MHAFHASITEKEGSISAGQCVCVRTNVCASEVCELYHTNIRELREFENTEHCENLSSIKTTHLQK